MSGSDTGEEQTLLTAGDTQQGCRICLGWCHRQCLAAWCRERMQLTCELCQQPYAAELLPALALAAQQNLSARRQANRPQHTVLIIPGQAAAELRQLTQLMAREHAQDGSCWHELTEMQKWLWTALPLLGSLALLYTLWGVTGWAPPPEVAGLLHFASAFCLVGVLLQLRWHAGEALLQRHQQQPGALQQEVV